MRMRFHWFQTHKHIRNRKTEEIYALFLHYVVSIGLIMIIILLLYLLFIFNTLAITVSDSPVFDEAPFLRCHYIAASVV